MASSEFRELYDIRDYQPSDKNFVLATFLRGVYYGDSWFSKIRKDIFMDNYKRIAEFAIDTGKVVVKVACLREDPDVIIGYSILSADYQAVSWVYVKKAWRLKGIARSLLPQYPQYITHLSELGEKLMPKLNTAVYNPFYGG
jgi:GNAT superfamily N-acetyltransferase